MADPYVGPEFGNPNNAQNPARANVTYTPIPTHDAGGKINIPKEESDAVWVDCYVQNHYEKDGHIYMMGTTTPPTTSYTLTTPGGPAVVTSPVLAKVAFVQLAAPTLTWVCDWTVERSVIKPDIPSPIPLDPNWVLIDEFYKTDVLQVGADGSSAHYRISGTYVYGHVNPSAVTADDLAFPRPPWLLDEFSRSVDQAQYKQGLSDFTRVRSVSAFPTLPTNPGQLI